MTRKTALLFAPFALALILLAPPSALAISRTTVLARAQSWIDSPVKYSQSRYHLGYRTDCSGYVSMCWKTGMSYCTSSFHAVTRRIKTSQLLPGDALLKRGYHIRLFYGWVDAAHTEYVAYEASTMVATCRIHYIADDLHAGYVPTRYKRITGSVVSANLLRNGSFNTWAQSWGDSTGQPVWWQTNGPWWQPIVAPRSDIYHSARTSLELDDPSGDPALNSDLSQTVPVEAGASYRLSAWAKSASDPRGLELRLTFLDAAGQSVAETSTTDESAAIGAAAFKEMSVAATAPTGTVSATVAMRLAGGSTAEATGAPTPGTSAILDDVSLVRQ